MKYEKIFLEEFEAVLELLTDFSEYFEFFNYERTDWSLLKKTFKDELG